MPINIRIAGFLMLCCVFWFFPYHHAPVSQPPPLDLRPLSAPLEMLASRFSQRQSSSTRPVDSQPAGDWLDSSMPRRAEDPSACSWQLVLDQDATYTDALEGESDQEVLRIGSEIHLDLPSELPVPIRVDLIAIHRPDFRHYCHRLIVTVVCNRTNSPASLGKLTLGRSEIYDILDSTTHRLVVDELRAKHYQRMHTHCPR